VGGTWVLAHAPGEIGTYLALTGETIGAGDAIYAGLADALVPASDLPKLREALALLGAAATPDKVSEAIAGVAQTPPTGLFEQQSAVIDATMQSKNVEEIVDALNRFGSQFATKTAETIVAKSPTSLKLTLYLLRLARFAPDLEACLVKEYRAATSLLKGHDFYEGVRAAVIDKDRQPRWSPAALQEVQDEAIAALLLPKPSEPLFPKKEALS
jgi:enoyl-CoA hydratase